MTNFEHLLSPIQLGSIQVRNRVLVSAHVPGFAEDNKPGEKYIDYQRQYAVGGVGLQITGGTPIHPSGMLSLNADGLWNLDDSIIPGYQKLSAAIHQEGGRILAQLAHSAGTVLIHAPGKQSWSASAIRSETTGNISHEMTLWEIEEVIEAYARGAERAAKGALDGVEILSAFGFLPQAFLSPMTNHRQDQYGGSLENRMRFLIEVLTAVRQVLGSEKILGVRLPGDEYEPGGLDLQQMKIVCEKLSNLNLVDYFNITAHTNVTLRGRARHWAPTPTPHGVFVDLAAQIRQVVSQPVFTVGRIVDPMHADQIIAEGKADMVGMTRAHICDPMIIKKIKQRAVTQIRPCVGANTCIASRYAGKPIRCMHNADVAKPGIVPDSGKSPKSIVVIGGGPAGLEVARIAAQRGHHVKLYEAKSYLGGQLALWAKSPSMIELGKIIDWRISELNRLNCDMVLDTPVDYDTLENISADVVIIATGAIENPRYINSQNIIPILTPHQLLAHQSLNKTMINAIVCSDGRGQAGLVAAEWLRHQGIEVELITSDYAVASDLDPTNRNAWYERLGKSGVVMTAQVEISSIDSSGVCFKGVFSNQITHRTGIDLIVDWNGCLSNDLLLKQMTDRPDNNTKSSEGSYKWHAIGDCLSPRNVEIAIAEAAYIASNL